MDRIRKLEKKVRRHPRLRALEGWYAFTVYSDIRISIPPTILHSYKFKISCNYDVIKRCTVISSPIIRDCKCSCHTDADPAHEHCSACKDKGYTVEESLYPTADNSKSMINEILTDPNIAVIYLPDMAGKIMWRMFARLMYVPKDGKQVLAVFHEKGRDYLNNEDPAPPILQFIDTQIIPVFFIAQKMDFMENPDRLVRLYSGPYDNDNVAFLKRAVIHMYDEDIKCNNNRLEALCYKCSAEGIENYV